MIEVTISNSREDLHSQMRYTCSPVVNSVTVVLINTCIQIKNVGATDINTISSSIKLFSLYYVELFQIIHVFILFIQFNKGIKCRCSVKYQVNWFVFVKHSCLSSIDTIPPVMHL